MASGPLSNEQVPGRGRNTLADEALRQDLQASRTVINTLQSVTNALTTTVTQLAQKLRRVGRPEGAEPWLGTPGANGYVLTSDTDDNRTWVAPGGGGSLSTSYIDGCFLRFKTTTTFDVDTGTAYVPLAAAGVDVTTLFTVNPAAGTGIAGGGTITLANNTIYYVHLVSGSTVEITTTAPTRYKGTAWQSAATNRYIGCFLTDGSAHIINFRRSGSYVFFKADTISAPFNIATATGTHTVSLTGIVPVTTFLIEAIVDLTAPGSPCYISFGTSDGLTATSAAGAPLVQSPEDFGGPTTHGQYSIDLDGSQAFRYVQSGTGVLVSLRGYQEDR